MVPRVLISDKLSPAAVQIFADRGVETVVKAGLDKDQLADIIGDFDGLAIRSATKVECSSSAERTTASGTTTTRPPYSSAPQISHTEKSNANEWHCDHTCPANPMSASSVCSNRVTLRCGIATPLGVPVVPEV